MKRSQRALYVVVATSKRFKNQEAIFFFFFYDALIKPAQDTHVNTIGVARTAIINRTHNKLKQGELFILSGGVLATPLVPLANLLLLCAQGWG